LVILINGCCPSYRRSYDLKLCPHGANRETIPLSHIPTPPDRRRHRNAMEGFTFMEMEGGWDWVYDKQGNLALLGWEQRFKEGAATEDDGWGGWMIPECGMILDREGWMHVPG